MGRTTKKRGDNGEPKLITVAQARKLVQGRLATEMKAIASQLETRIRKEWSANGVAKETIDTVIEVVRTIPQQARETLMPVFEKVLVRNARKPPPRKSTRRRSPK